ncbi:coiled-coil domain-containing protein [Paenibacillus lentus]|uniref:coiled-coil domain-containing protein n=1 Tax=Paenibacillus lentus TaxID=1338368 RepID=UPI00364A030D
MNRRIISFCSSCALIASLFMTLVFPIPPAYALPLSEEEQEVLEKSLSIVEIDREITRIEIKQQDTERSMLKLSRELAKTEGQMLVSQERAGARLRAYYMGEREDLLAALLSANSWKDFFTVLDYYQLIMERDRDVLAAYKKELAKLNKSNKQLSALAGELEEMKNNLLKQRERVVELQRSVDGKLGASTDPEHLRAMIEELTTYWENVGLHEVRRYFRALASAMMDFQDFLKDHQDSLVSENGGYVLVIREEDLNAFLHGKNALLSNMAFIFEEEKIIATGSREGLDLRVEGHYSVENEPQNAIVFHVDRLVFNGLELPDTTRLELQNDFDLGFYPQKIVPFVKAEEAVIQKGTLTVKLKLSL